MACRLYVLMVQGSTFALPHSIDCVIGPWKVDRGGACGPQMSCRRGVVHARDEVRVVWMQGALSAAKRQGWAKLQCMSWYGQDVSAADGRQQHPAALCYSPSVPPPQPHIAAAAAVSMRNTAASAVLYCKQTE